jgi:CRP-like cAMP-binding protein
MRWRLLEPLDDEERERVLALARRRRYRRGAVIFHEGEPGEALHLLDHGHVAVRRSTPEGELVTYMILSPGEVFGELALVGAGSTRSSTIQALDAVETLTLHRDQFDTLRRDHPGVDRMLVEALSADVRRLSDRLLEALHTPVATRVLRRLAELAEVYVEDGAIPLTQDDLAGLAGTSRPSANKALRAAEQAGVIKVGRGRVTVIDFEELVRRGGLGSGHE